MLVSKNTNFVQNKTILHNTSQETPISLNSRKYCHTHISFSMILEKNLQNSKIINSQIDEEKYLERAEFFKE